MATDPRTTLGAPSPARAHLTEPHRRRATLILMVVTALFVIVPFWFWQETWFGRPLTEEELGQYLLDPEKPRQSQHALAQIVERMARGDASVRRWYPEVVRLAKSPSPEIRITLAWVLGADSRAEEFHRTLWELLEDPESLVRRNAALSLVRFGDARGRRELLEMLRPYTILAPADGVLRYRLQEADAVDQGTLVARLERSDKEPLEIRSPWPGTIESKAVQDGSHVVAGEGVLVLAPGPEHVWEALRALYLVGLPEDLPDVERFAQGAGSGMPPKIQGQAVLTAAEIRRRAGETTERKKMGTQERNQ